MADNFEDDREHMYTNRVYNLVGSDGWVDIKTLSVHINKTKDGVKVQIYPIDHDGRTGPLAVCSAQYVTEAKRPAEMKVHTVYKAHRIKHDRCNR